MYPVLITKFDKHSEINTELLLNIIDKSAGAYFRRVLRLSKNEINFFLHKACGRI